MKKKHNQLTVNTMIHYECSLVSLHVNMDEGRTKIF